MHPLVDYLRCPEHLAARLGTAHPLPAEEGYFRFGDAVCYGRQSVGKALPRPDDSLADAARGVASAGGTVLLPFDLGEVLDNLRYERYTRVTTPIERVSTSDLAQRLYYLVRPVLPVGLRKHVQRMAFAGWRKIPFPGWPVDTTVERLVKEASGLLLERGGIAEIPFIWFWPEGASACAMMTHDVEGADGAKFCDGLMDLDDRFGIRSAFQVVPEAPWSSNGETMRTVDGLRVRGFEVNVHDLAHDGNLFRDRERFLGHAAEIKARAVQFGSRGFRAGAMYRRQDWFAALGCSYDMSVPNVAHLEPQRGGCCTVMPYFIGDVLELPLTTSQDHTVFHVLGDYSTALWREQVERILGENGLISFIAHPDYLLHPRAREVYAELLDLIVQLRDERNVWVALPGEIDDWWRQRRAMRLVPDGDTWRIVGEGSERARVAFARFDGDRVAYEVGTCCSASLSPGHGGEGQGEGGNGSWFTV